MYVDGMPLRAHMICRMPKIPLEKGYSQMDWLRLTEKDKNLNGLSGGPPRTDITFMEVRKHKTIEDAWMILNGLVRNCSNSSDSASCQVSPAMFSCLLVQSGFIARTLIGLHPD